MSAIIFVAAVFLAFYLPGSFFLPRKRFTSPLVYLTLSLILGLVLWGWQEFIFGYLGVRGFSYLYLAFFFLAWVFKKNKNLSARFAESRRAGWRIRIDKILLLMVAVGIFIQVVPIWQNGVNFQNKGLMFDGCNTEDNLWHAALTKEMVQRFPPHGPGLADTAMKNYHYWSDMVVAATVRVFRLPLLASQFHFFPILISLLLGLATIALCQTLRLSSGVTRLAVFFNYFGGDLIYWATFKMSSLEDGARFLCNQPTAFSYVIALGGLALLVAWLKGKNGRLGLLSSLVLAATIGFKVYTFFFLAPGILLLTVFAFFRRRWQEGLTWAAFFFFALVIYLPVNSGAGGLVWTPFLIANNFIAQPGLNLIRWEMARIIFFNDKKYFINLVFEGWFTLIFLTAVLGTKVFGFFQSPLFLVKKLGGKLTLIMLLGTLTSLGGGLFFIQTTGGANTFNFLVSIFLFNSLLVGLAYAYWQKKLPKIMARLLLALLILLTLPRVTFETVNHLKNFFHPQGFLLTNEELDLYKFINQNASPQATVAIDPNHYLGRNSPYVSVFLERPLLLSGNGLLKHFHLDVTAKEASQKIIFNSDKGNLVAEELLTNRIEYLFLYDVHHLSATESALFTKVAQKNSAGTVLEVLPEEILKNFPKLKPNLVLP